MRAAIVFGIGLLGCSRPSPSTVLKVMPNSPDLDVLFMIDDSTSTLGKQALFAASVQSLTNAFDQFPGGRPNLHIGVISSTVDIGVQGVGCASPLSTEDGRLLHSATVNGCSPPSDSYIVDVAQPDGTRLTNYAGNLSDAVACISQLGDAGCGFEAPLEAIKRALDGRYSDNTGFVRPGAALAVVILTDEDDCSVSDSAIFRLSEADVGAGDYRCQPLYAYNCDQAISATNPGNYTNCSTRTGSYLSDPQSYVQFLKSLKGELPIYVGLIAGDPTKNIGTGAITVPFSQRLSLLPSCSGTLNGQFAIGRPAIRLNDFLASFGDHGDFHSVCDPSYTTSLSLFGGNMGTMMGPCLEGPIAISDADPTQLRCSVDDVTPNVSRASVAPCKMLSATQPDPAGVRPCWWVNASPSCPAVPGLAFHMERSVAPAAGSYVAVQCPTH